MANPLIRYPEPTRKVGFVLKPHGFKGQLRIHIEDEDDDVLLKKGAFLFLELDSKWVPFYIQEINADKTVVKLEDVDTEAQALKLVNTPLLHFAKEASEDDLPDLTGYTVIDEAKNFEAEVTGIVEMPGHSLIETRWQFREVLIPLHDDIILEIDDENRIIRADLPEGLLEL